MTKDSNFVVAKSPDGSVQINFTIAFDVIDKARAKAIVDLAENVEVPGFRKGKAPKDLVESKLNHNELYSKSVEKLLPEIYTQAVKEHKLAPILYPKIKLIKAELGKGAGEEE